MDKYIGFDIDDKKTVACVVQKGKKDVYETMQTDVEVMRYWLKKQRKPKDKLHLTFEVSGQAGWLYDELIDSVDTLTVSNPSKMTWIFRTSKKTDRIDARKQAVLLQIGEIPKVHMPGKDIRQWRLQIQHRRKLVSSCTQTKNRIRMLLKNHGYRQPEHKGSWWKKTNRNWMRQLSENVDADWSENKRKKIAIVATARKMLSIMRAMQITGEVFNEKLVLEQEHMTFAKELSA